VLFGIFNGSFS